MSAVEIATPDAMNVLSSRIREAAEIMKSMASETRLKILCGLSEGEMSVNQLADLTDQSLSAVSQHLAKLRASGLVEWRRDAQTIYYRCAQGVGRALVETLCSYYKP